MIPEKLSETIFRALSDDQGMTGISIINQDGIHYVAVYVRSVTDSIIDKVAAVCTDSDFVILADDSFSIR